MGYIVLLHGMNVGPSLDFYGLRFDGYWLSVWIQAPCMRSSRVETSHLHVLFAKNA